MMRRVTALARWARAGGPLAWLREHAARTAIGMPARHPERVTRQLGRRDEAWLTAVAAALWPDDEYTEIVRDTRRDGGR